jgi:hypothetical protein
MQRSLEHTNPLGTAEPHHNFPRHALCTHPRSHHTHPEFHLNFEWIFDNAESQHRSEGLICQNFHKLRAQNCAFGVDLEVSRLVLELRSLQHNCSREHPESDSFDSSCSEKSFGCFPDSHFLVSVLGPGYDKLWSCWAISSCCFQL